jgi:hypothetical protein
MSLELRSIPADASGQAHGSHPYTEAAVYIEFLLRGGYVDADVLCKAPTLSKGKGE